MTDIFLYDDGHIEHEDKMAIKESIKNLALCIGALSGIVVLWLIVLYVITGFLGWRA